jgi:LmbE family N-acetylglucosaminyl deacetylase
MNRAKGRQVLDCARGLAHSKTLTRRFVQFMVAAACCLIRLPAVGQVAEPPSSASILQDLRNFDTVGSVLYVAAHPDDEDTQLITFLARGRHYRSAYLSVNRGDGGQNVLGPEFGEELGVIRTEELLAARRLDGGEQFFTRAIDFGYSKDYRETLRIWDHQQVLSDVVRVIRTFQPDVVVAGFSTNQTPGQHGHHVASAILAGEAFKLAGDPKAFPDQLDYLKPWQPRRLLQRSGGFGGRGGGGSSAAGPHVEISGNDPVLGISFGEIANRSRAMHKSQGFGNFGGFGGGGGGGARISSFVVLDGEPATNDIMDGIDTTWSRVPGGADIGKQADEIIAQFDTNNPSASVEALLSVKKNLSVLPDSPLLELKRKLLDKILQECLGLSVATTVQRAEVVAGEPLKLNFAVNLAPNRAVHWRGIRLPVTGREISLPDNEPMGNIVNQGNLTSETTETLPAMLPLSEPYWLREEPTVGMFRVDDPKLIGQPESPPAFPVEYVFRVGDQTLVVTDEPVQAGTESGKFEARRTLKIISPVSLAFGSGVVLFEPGAKKTVEVEITAARADVSGTLHLESPADWKISPASQPFKMANAGEKMRLAFTVTAPSQPASGSFLAVAEIGGQKFSNGRYEIRYDHIPVQLLQSAARLKVVAFDYAIRGKSVGYLPGAGDDTAEDLAQLGYAVTTLTGADLTADKLHGLDAVVIGVRAFNERTDFATNFPALLAWVEQGGTVIAQYNRPNGLRTQQLGPYPLSIQGQAPPLRVTDENAPVTFLLPDHPALNVPNKITAADFAGWVQERGAYFASQWDDRYAAPLAMSDPGEKQPNSSLLIAKDGNGYYVYTSLAFFRQLPDGVPGTYRLFANLVSLGK